MRNLSLLIALAVASTALVLPASAGSPPTKETCVNYAYVADYNWYYLCVAPDPSCPVYTMWSNGVVKVRECVAEVAFPESAPVCTPFIGDMDHMNAYCAAVRVDCPLWRESQSGARTCLA